MKSKDGIVYCFCGLKPISKKCKLKFIKYPYLITCSHDLSKKGGAAPFVTSISAFGKTELDAKYNWNKIWIKTIDTDMS